MKTVRISLNSIDKVKSFVNDLAKFDVDFDLVSGNPKHDYAFFKDAKTGETILEISQTAQNPLRSGEKAASKYGGGLDKKEILLKLEKEGIK